MLQINFCHSLLRSPKAQLSIKSRVRYSDSIKMYCVPIDGEYHIELYVNSNAVDCTSPFKHWMNNRTLGSFNLRLKYCNLTSWALPNESVNVVRCNFGVSVTKSLRFNVYPLTINFIVWLNIYIEDNVQIILMKNFLEEIRCLTCSF